MKQAADLACRFLTLADRDIRTCALLLAVPESDDQVIGFHAQQAVEKCFKAVLAAKQIAFRRTHDLVELRDLLCEAGFETAELESLESLNPFAVTLRYDIFDIEPVDRSKISASLSMVRSWAEIQVQRLIL